MVPRDYSLFLGEGVLAATSDTSVNFHKPVLQAAPAAAPAAGGFPLTPSQQAWLLGEGILSPDKVVFPKQVHGDEIWIADEAASVERGVREADAVVTDRKGLPIAVRTADCLPVLMFAPDKKVIAAVHAGWKSTKLGIVRKTVCLLQQRFGADLGRLRAAFGPCIRRGSYDVGEEFRAHFPEDVHDERGRLCFDLPGANQRQLLAVGVRPENIFDCGLDTVTRREHHSFRRDGEQSGRMINVIMMK